MTITKNHVGRKILFRPSVNNNRLVDVKLNHVYTIGGIDMDGDAFFIDLEGDRNFAGMEPGRFAGEFEFVEE